ncbi:hypothetical protein YC2023_052942 [Brassica napus]
MSGTTFRNCCVYGYLCLTNYHMQHRSTVSPPSPPSLTKAWISCLSSFSSYFLRFCDLGLLRNHTKALCLSAGAGHAPMAMAQIELSDVTAVELVDSLPLERRADTHNLHFSTVRLISRLLRILMMLCFRGGSWRRWRGRGGVLIAVHMYLRICHRWSLDCCPHVPQNLPRIIISLQILIRIWNLKFLKRWSLDCCPHVPQNLPRIIISLQILIRICNFSKIPPKDNQHKKDISGERATSFNKGYIALT